MLAGSGRRRYIGLIGSRSKVRATRERLARDGISAPDCLYAPVGLALGAQSPAEIAVAVAAEVVALLRGASVAQPARPVTLFEPPVAGARLQMAALTTFGLEALAAEELRRLDFADPVVENGRVRFVGGPSELARACLWLRTADRVVLRLAEFPAPDFDALYQGVQAVRWEEFLPEDARLEVSARSHRSAPHGAALLPGHGEKRHHPGLAPAPSPGTFPGVRSAVRGGPGPGPRPGRAQPGRHRRRPAPPRLPPPCRPGPLRETLAAALVLLSRWEPSRPLADPLCGSGTIAIEAALLGLGLAPGRLRGFTAESWPHLPQSLWREARAQARAREQSAGPAALSLEASDRDEGMVRVARENARAAGVGEAVRFRVQPAEEFRSAQRYGCLICNPPYGERSGQAGEVEELYRRLGRTFSRLPDWSVFVLTGHPGFERLYGRRADRNRKLYNGNLKTYLYQYFGPLPPGGAPPETEAPGARAAGAELPPAGERQA